MHCILLVLSIQECLAWGIAKNLTAKSFQLERPLLFLGSTNQWRERQGGEKGGFLLDLCDAGPGMEVPVDSTSQGRDSVNASGHAIPAVLYGNQYAVLFDTEPTDLEDLDGF